jgi:hypothetical protein
LHRQVIAERVSDSSLDHWAALFVLGGVRPLSSTVCCPPHSADAGMAVG